MLDTASLRESLPDSPSRGGKAPPYDAVQMSLDLQERYDVDVDLTGTKLAAVTSSLRECLSPRTFAFLQTLCEPVFSRLSPDLVNVEAMLRQLETALVRSLDVCSRGVEGEDPEKLFEPLAGSLVAMLRDVVSNPAKVVENARLKASDEARQGERDAAKKAKAAAKEAKRALAASRKAARLAQRQEGGREEIAAGGDEAE
ncbi:hypothetical protein EMIHUDRAFT_433232 [Emiliania huxleyi CCMP1516]|uniref:Uncharacterized protein n=3 Tax=Emiliania huxleyi TaxID=2903 RepID=A0A0D3KZE0_EMIH1|nr:hypothetical protein EMIHUDRAFT_433232 [Emiliania huxleyi CCMP1516]EOD41125.1 hypothetical protein EMIHUDRAFT_433232 [Emiliania huxleyi CCMP1516]|mmetsp:Transcript_8520/g.25752  ORF Transcript_8520/g.25752 Transcript_8520/m.25752 type:complete len:200 (+) Transcript_8520:57-656(+)|eukprot:XP_005793554.1 hypothetical protein EMIHUDRAFT_433232 [Emiliania huxleyi CCMP1516]